MSLLILAMLAAGCGSGGGPSGPPTYTRDVQPILAAKCGSCHGGQGAGNQNIATSYADTQKMASVFAVCMNPPVKVGQCALILIQMGTMPFLAGCTGNPTMDASNAACTTQAQQDTIQAWINAGLPE
jgi:hypothetical protein